VVVAALLVVVWPVTTTSRYVEAKEVKEKKTICAQYVVKMHGAISTLPDTSSNLGYSSKTTEAG
jgi:hypothetical protein